LQTIFFWTLIARNISRGLDRDGLLTKLWETTNSSSEHNAPRSNESDFKSLFSPEQTQQIEAAFRLFDTDNSNALDKHEMFSALFALGYITDSSNCHVLDGHWGGGTAQGTVSLEQFKQMLQGSTVVRSHLDEIKKTFCAIVDRGWTNEKQSSDVESLLLKKIDTETLQEACQRYEIQLSEEEIKHIIMEADQDNNEVVDWEEYMHILKHSCWF